MAIVIARRFAAAAGLSVCLAGAGLPAASGATHGVQHLTTSTATSAPAASDWPMYRHGPARNGVASETTVGVGNVARLAVVSRRSEQGETLGEVISAGGLGYYTFGSSHLRAVRRPALTSVWNRQLGCCSGLDESDPAVVGGVLYSAAASTSKVYALDAATNAVRWIYNPALGDDVQSSVAVSDGLVFVAYRGGSLVALDAATGAAHWRVPSVHNGAIGDLWSSPGVWNGRVYIAAENLSAYDVASGRRAFSTRLPISGDYSLLPPALAGGLAIVPSEKGLTGIDAATGAVRWSRALGSCSPVALNGGVVYAACAGKLIALTAATGARRWSVTVPGGTDFGGTTYANGVVYVPGHTQFLGFDASGGRLLWSAATSDPFPLTSSVTVSAGTVYGVAFGGEVTSYRVR